MTGSGTGHWPGCWLNGLSVYGRLLTVVTLCHGLYACGSSGVGGICQEPVGAAETGSVEAAEAAGVGAAEVPEAAGLVASDTMKATPETPARGPASAW